MKNNFIKAIIANILMNLKAANRNDLVLTLNY